MGKPKIAILGSRGIPASYGGFETFAEELSLRLVERGVDVTVYCESNNGSGPRTYQRVELRHIKLHRLGPLTRILFDLKCLWHARKSYHIIYMLGYSSSLFCFIPRVFGTTVWINMDGIEWSRSKWNKVVKIWLAMMESIALFTPSRIICDAESIKSFLFSRHSIIPACSLIPYGALIVEGPGESSFLEDLHLLPRSYYLIVCRLEPENHILDIIEGFLMSKTRRSLVIVGSSQTKTAYVEKLLGRTTDKRIRFIGTIFEKGKLKTLRVHAFAYFHGHSVGGTNPSLLEAMGCGNIIIAHDNVFNKEVAGQVAFLFRNSNDILRIIDKIEMMNDEEIKIKSLKAKEIIRDKYDWDKITEAYLYIINWPLKS